MASHNLKAFSLLRHWFKELIIPLWWIVDYRGEAFEVQSISPISINSLVYGTDTHGLSYLIKDFNSEDLARKISERLNLKAHKFIEHLTINGKNREFNIFLPYSVQLHRSSGREEYTNYYIVNPGALFWCDTILTNDKDYVPKLLVRQLRPEWIINNHSDKVVEGYSLQTWKTPTRWCICAHFIREYDYFYYEKKTLEGPSKRYK